MSIGRIRSIHPGIYTDEVFMELTPLERLLYIGLLSFSDDAGVFKFKEKTLKALIFPADNCDIYALLSALEHLKAIMVYTVDGVKYGAVRNFNKFQSPRWPRYRYPKTDEVCAFTCFKRGATTEFIRKSDLEGVGEGEGERKSLSSIKTSVQKYVGRFDEFWKAFDDPGKRGKKPAFKKWSTINPGSLLADRIIAGAKLYRKMCVVEKRERQFCKMAQGWLSDSSWEDEIEISPFRLEEAEGDMPEQRPEDF